MALRRRWTVATPSQTFSGASWAAPKSKIAVTRLSRGVSSIYNEDNILFGPTTSFGALLLPVTAAASARRMQCCNWQAPAATPLPPSAGTMHSWECDPKKGPGAFKIAETWE